MAFHRKKHPVSDPAHYDSLISDQTKCARQDPNNTEEWFKLGLLCEARIGMIRNFSRRVPPIRYFIPLYLTLILFSIVITTHFFPNLVSIPVPYIAFLIICTIFLVLMLVRLWFLRYPPSGKKYFKKAVRIDPSCAEGYIQLGLIALRRHQKRKGCGMLEKALQLNGDNQKIEKELKAIYEKEFVVFFNRKSQRVTRQEKIVARQNEEIKALRSRIASLESTKGRLNERADQAKWEAAHTAKRLKKEMTDRVAAIRTEHKVEIGAIRASKNLVEEEKELAQKNFIKLTTEIVEAKTEIEGRSLQDASEDVRVMVGSNLWFSLLEQTRNYLATAEHTLKLLIGNRGDPDYSLVGMELCKALETEINRSLIEPFPEFLNGNDEEFLIINEIGAAKGKPLYFTYLAKVVDMENFPGITSLTLGQYHFVLKKTLDQDYALREYGDFLEWVAHSSKTVIGKTFLKKLEIVTKRYRNAIVHGSPMTRKECYHLRKLIFAGRNSLLGTCTRVLETSVHIDPQIQPRRGAV
jgi:hypothetical protein